jgi:hypothetical protein
VLLTQTSAAHQQQGCKEQQYNGWLDSVDTAVACDSDSKKSHQEVHMHECQQLQQASSPPPLEASPLAGLHHAAAADPSPADEPDKEAATSHEQPQKLQAQQAQQQQQQQQVQDVQPMMLKRQLSDTGSCGSSSLPTAKKQAMRQALQEQLQQVPEKTEKQQLPDKLLKGGGGSDGSSYDANMWDAATVILSLRCG